MQVQSRPYDPNGLKAKQVRCLSEDNHHNYWVGTENGVFIFNREKERIKRGSAFDQKGNVAQTLNGILNIDSKPNTGTKVVLEVKFA